MANGGGNISSGAGREFRDVFLVSQLYCGTDLRAKLSFVAVGIPKWNFRTSLHELRYGRSVLPMR